ncbi:hypothetical protein C2E23DRAFT_271274 [Lenzites betulinus]|nr:hypothetical protein C2E23DRAFT_271274 [Lenzites betulinus]
MALSSVPVEIWALIIDSLSYSISFTSLDRIAVPERMLRLAEDHSRLRQRDLYSCALVCHTWHPHAQRLLYQDPHLVTLRALQLFVALLRHPNVEWGHLASSICAHGFKHRRRSSPTVSAICHSLFMTSVLRPRSFTMTSFFFFPAGLDPQVLQMRLPIFSNVSTLCLERCLFRSRKDLLDIIWACPGLSRLELSNIDIASTTPYLTPEQVALWVALRTRLRACELLTSVALSFVGNIYYAPPYSGNFLGCAVTRLDITVPWDTSTSGRANPFQFLHGSFPLLRNLSLVISECFTINHNHWRPYTGPSLLYMLAGSLPEKHVLETVLIRPTYAHHVQYGESDTLPAAPLRADSTRAQVTIPICCQSVVGTPGAEEQALPQARLATLQSCTIVLDRNLPGLCMSYIDAALPGLAHVLQFAGYHWTGRLVPLRRRYADSQPTGRGRYVWARE